MAISPNTTFSSGAILTAAQMNALPWGIVALGTSTATDNFTVEETEITATTFTAVANRYYRISYFEPKLYASGGTNEVNMRIRLNNVTGTLQQTGWTLGSSTTGQNSTTSFVKTFPAGATVLVATLQISASSGTAERSSTQFAYLLVEDIGPA
jgi:hypothetical protein